VSTNKAELSRGNKRVRQTGLKDIVSKAPIWVSDIVTTNTGDIEEPARILYKKRRDQKLEKEQRRSTMAANQKKKM
jgi:hypothetical protein